MATVDGMSEDVGKCNNTWQQAFDNGWGSSDEQRYVFGSCFKGKGNTLKQMKQDKKYPILTYSIQQKALAILAKKVSNTRQGVSIRVLMWRTWGL
jgi:hypothetical protein